MGLARTAGCAMKKTLRQAIRFAVVGLASNGVGFCLYLFLTWAGMGPKLAMSVLFCIGTLQTFVFNKQWSFQYRGKDRMVMLRYLAAYGMGYLVNLTALVGLVDYLHFRHAAVQGLMILVVAALMFLLQKFWVFAPNIVEQNKPS
jgi:putative flippase GtrA